MGYHWVIKSSEVLTHVATWMNFENIMQCERTQTPKATYCVISLISNAQNRRIYRSRKEISSCQGLGGEKNWIMWVMCTEGLFGGAKMFSIRWWLHNSYKYTKTHWSVYFKRINFWYVNYLKNYMTKNQIMSYSELSFTRLVGNSILGIIQAPSSPISCTRIQEADMYQKRLFVFSS